MLNTTFKICAVEDTGTAIRIKDENKQTWSFFKTLKAGGPTKAMQQFVQYKVGDVVGVGYNENPNPKNPQYPFKNIMNFTPPNYAQAAQKVQQQVIAPPSVKYEPTAQAEPKNDRFWDKKAYKQCLWGYWLQHHSAFRNVSMSEGSLGDAEMDLVWQVFNQIEQDADKRFSTGWAKAEAIFGEDPLPEAPPEEEVTIDVSGIPF